MDVGLTPSALRFSTTVGSVYAEEMREKIYVSEQHYHREIELQKT